MARLIFRSQAIQTIRFAFVIPILLFSQFANAGRAPHTDSRTLIVAIDKSAYTASELDLLSDQVLEAARSQKGRINVIGGDTTVTITIRDANRDEDFVDTVKNWLTENPGLSIDTTPARTFWISYSAESLKTYGRNKFESNFGTLEDLIYSLRTPFPDTTIEGVSDGAIVRSANPSVADILTKKLRGTFDVAPLTNSSWHVVWNDEVLSRYTNPAKRVNAIRNTDRALREFLGDPLDLLIERYDQSAVFTVQNPELHAKFAESVRNTFSASAGFVLTEAPSTVLRIAQRDRESESADAANAQTPNLDLLGKLDELANPKVEVTALGNVVTLRARDSSGNAGCAAIVRQAFAGRSDVVMTTEPDQSLQIALVPGAHIGPPPPQLTPNQLVKGVETRASALNIRPEKITAIGLERVQVQFNSEADATAFRQALSDRYGFSIRIVDEVQQGSDTTEPPSPGDGKLALPTGGLIWVRPETIVTGNMIADMTVGVNSFTKRPNIGFRLTDEGRLHFAAATRENVGKRFAIVHDGHILAAPVIMEPIEGVEGQIDGNFTSAETIVKSVLVHKNDLPLIVELN
jgi:hypothetical protein